MWCYNAARFRVTLDVSHSFVRSRQLVHFFVFDDGALFSAQEFTLAANRKEHIVS